jgi:protein O-GlcNAc transferase
MSASSPDQDPAFHALLSAHAAGRFSEALAGYLAILAGEPDQPDALHLAGLVMVETDAPERGIRLITRALSSRPESAPYHNSLGMGLSRLGRHVEAITAYRTAASARPDSAEIVCNLATACLAAGDPAEAITHYQAAAAIAPENGDIWRNLARALEGRAPLDEVEATYRRAIASAPGSAGSHADFGRWLLGQGRWGAAAAALEAATRLDHNDSAAWHNLGRALAESGDLSRAEQAYRQALTLNPGFAGSHFNLGCLSHGDGRTDEAVAHFGQAILADPLHGAARIAVCMAELPLLPMSQDEIVTRRTSYLAALDRLVASVRSPDVAASVAAAIGSTQPFFLPYQGEDDREPQAKLGQMMCGLAAAAWPAGFRSRRAISRADGRPIKVGIVSGWFQDHTVFRLFLDGWLEHLDRDRFHVTGFHTGSGRDSNTDQAAAACDTFVQDLPSPVAWRDAIAAAEQDVLLYPEVGMDPTAGFLAAHRLAPVQCVAWGQPVTTGLPTMDYFLSSDLMEPDDGAAHYTETLIRLPALGVCVRRDTARHTPASRASLGLPDDAVVYWSGQSLFKYHPRHDDVFPRIARQVRHARFLFIAFARGTRVTAMFQERLDRSFAHFGLDARQYCTILPAMDQARFIATMGAADVVLDTLEWSGGRSTLDGLVWDTPVVTLSGRFMRGRHTAAILRQAGCDETIATSVAGHVAIATRLGLDPAWRERQRRTLAEGRNRVFDDISTIRVMERFLIEAVNRRSAENAG